MKKSTKITVFITLAAAFCFLQVSLAQTAPYAPTPEEEASYPRIYSEYLIITHDDFYDQVVPLAEFKMENGLDVKVVRISEIGADPSAEEIADFIRDEYRRSIPYERPSCRLDAILQYVLLVGDVDYIPAHYRLNYGSATDYHATDLYYATIDSADYLPDIAVGRLPANSTTDVENMVNKIINYVPLTNRVLLFGNSPETDYADSDEPILTDAGFVVDKAYDATSCLETTNRINDGRLLAVYYGHGCVTGAGCALTESNIDELENTVLPVVLSGGCSNMYFDH
jgi:hypothetical protein